MEQHASAPLYNPQWEHDACGIGFVARVDAQRSHEIIQLALDALCNLEHRGATDADGRSGDGAGVMTHLPYKLLARHLRGIRLEMPAPEDVAVAQCFLPLDHVSESRQIITKHMEAAGIPVLAWRVVPTNDGALGMRAMQMKPLVVQAILQRPATIPVDAWERTLFKVRRAVGLEAHERALEGFYITSMSSRTIVYKGLMNASQLGTFYPDLKDPEFVTQFAVYHQRFSTNNLPTW